MTTREAELRKEVDRYPDDAIGSKDVEYVFTLLDTERMATRTAEAIAHNFQIDIDALADALAEEQMYRQAAEYDAGCHKADVEAMERQVTALSNTLDKIAFVSPQWPTSDVVLTLNEIAWASGPRAGAKKVLANLEGGTHEDPL